MVDVRNVLVPVTAAFGTGIAVFAAGIATGRSRGSAWRAVSRGAGALVFVAVVVGVAVLFFFDAAFLLFHLLLFPGGNFAFDPRTERLTQLFPEQFWTDSIIGIAVVGLATALLVTLGARRLAARLPN